MSRTQPLYLQLTIAAVLLVVATVAATRAFATGTGIIAAGSALVVIAGALALAFARRVMLDPEENPSHNVTLGLGVKLPTGENSANDTRRRYDADEGEFTYNVETVDQSIRSKAGVPNSG